jgi:hypothetical protein
MPSFHLADFLEQRMNYFTNSLSSDKLTNKFQDDIELSTTICILKIVQI